METNLLDRMLDAYQAGRTPVTITLQNKIRISGKIKAFDSYVIIMDSHKREVLYRHAVTCLAPILQEEHKRPPATSRPAPSKTASPGPAKSASRKPVQPHPKATAPSATDSLNNTMKDGLLKWMQEHKAAE